MEEGKRIREEFGFEREKEAVKEYGFLNRDFMYPNYPLIAEEIVSKLSLEEGFILDIGTGLGSLAIEFARRLPAAKIYGIDISQDMLDEAKRFARREKINNVEFMLCDTHKITFEDNFFDLVVSFGVLHHLSDLKVTFSEIKRVLKKNCPAYIYDLRKDAPKVVVNEVASRMNPSYKKAFLESVKEAFDLSYLEDMLVNLNFSEYSLRNPRYSRRTIIKNKRLLKQSKFLGERFNKILVETFLKK